MARENQEKVRLDRRLVEQQLADSREKAQAMILAGLVLVDERKVEKCGALVETRARIRLLGPPPRFVSRGGLKLDEALDFFGVNPRGKTALDIGASTGGFTDCLLQRGAARVFAVDVGTNQLNWKLRRDPRVTVLEKTNARYLKAEQIPGRADLATMDVSFISATLILPALPPLLVSGADLLVLVKPQFELSRAEIGAGGVVRDTKLHAQTVERVSRKLAELGFRGLESHESALAGAAGNREYFLHAVWKKDA
jgi:23S rRNA (cytidine1920-2'-O)/16S rRNA (cytidine1409-2'-O)-methyltransferase